MSGIPDYYHQIEFYEEIIKKELGKAEEYSKSKFTKEASEVRLKCIDDLIECINSKHKDFNFDRVKGKKLFLFRTLILNPPINESDESSDDFDF